MVGVVVAMVMSVGGAAAVLTVLARRNAPGEGWRGALRSGMHLARSTERPVDGGEPAEEAPAAGLDAIFEIGEEPEEPAYSEASAVQHVLERARQKGPAVSTAVHQGLERARQKSPALAKIIPHTPHTPHTPDAPDAPQA
jgi:hypothetical protein